MLRTVCIIAILCLSWPAPVAATASPVVALFDSETAARIRALLEERGAAATARVAAPKLSSNGLLIDLYSSRDYRPLWLEGWQLTGESESMLEALREAGAQGLCANDYLLGELEGLLRIQADFGRRHLPLAPENRALLDLFLSQAFFTYATDMVEGQVDPALAHVDWRARRRKANLIKLLEYALDNHRLPQVLSDISPPHREYRQLLELLRRYQGLAAHGGWPRIEGGRSIQSGQRDPRLAPLRRLLQVTGDLAAGFDPDAVYDEATEAAVRRFQSRHGLVDDGVVGPKTLAVMNVPIEERIRQLELNLERWRWMPKSFGKRYIRVNIADFSLKVVDNGETVMSMPVIVGTRYRKTPVFSARMTYLEFAPYWTVPLTILREDKLPRIRRNLDYLSENHFRVISRGDGETALDPQSIDWSSVRAGNFPGLLRMDPGPWNPLGRVKFIFPNRFNVYLHDTNERGLFDNNVRSFSSGCIRVERPRELVRYLLGDDVSDEQLDDLLNAAAPMRVSIEPLPVHVQYWTAWVDDEGRANFREDVYLRDLDLDVALREPSFRVMDQLQQVSIDRQPAESDRH
jgi:murein L,D-transpeptidase YcbB/YkuD